MCACVCVRAQAFVRECGFVRVQSANPTPQANTPALHPFPIPFPPSPPSPPSPPPPFPFPTRVCRTYAKVCVDAQAEHHRDGVVPRCEVRLQVLCRVLQRLAHHCSKGVMCYCSQLREEGREGGRRGGAGRWHGEMYARALCIHPSTFARTRVHTRTHAHACMTDLLTP